MSLAALPCGHLFHAPCPICAGPPGAPWTALPCGHLFHARCIMKGAAAETRGARGAAALPPCTVARCPMDRCAATRVVPRSEAAPEGALPVLTPESPAEEPPP